MKAALRVVRFSACSSSLIVLPLIDDLIFDFDLGGLLISGFKALKSASACFLVWNPTLTSAFAGSILFGIFFL